MQLDQMAAIVIGAVLPQAAQDGPGPQLPHARRLGRSEDYDQLIARPMPYSGVTRGDGAIRMAPR